ncbi:MAG: TraR/DksA C4-type zinc finger protein [Anaerolineae bacterium]|nr:TraR/DksA C4-type zinc finger protein [Anaerolineae bacterium]
MTQLEALLQASAVLHNHLCPRQVLGVRMGMYAAESLRMECPQPQKRLFTFVETDGCFADGISVATGCTLGHRTLRLMDYGKVAATFVDIDSERSIRIRPRLDVRNRAALCKPDERSPWHSQLKAYQVMPLDELFEIKGVSLSISLEDIISRPGVRVNCSICGEEIINERESIIEGLTLCRACAGDGYYHASMGYPSMSKLISMV